MCIIRSCAILSAVYNCRLPVKL